MNDSYSVKTGILHQFSTAYGSMPGVDEFVLAEGQQLLQEILKQLDESRFSHSSPLQLLIRRTASDLQVSATAKAVVDTFLAKFQYSQAELLLQSYLLALKSDDCSESTIKNYRSDIRQFLNFTQETAVQRIFTKPKVAQFLRNEKTKGLTKSSIRRKVVSISQFAIWLELIGVIRMHSQQWLVELSQHFDELYVQQLVGTVAAPSLEVKHPVKVETPEVLKAKTTPIQTPNTSLTATLSPLWSRLLPQRTKKASSPQVELPAILPKGTSPLKGQDRRFQLKQRLYQLQSRLTNRSRVHVLPYLNLLLSLILFLGMGYFGYLQIFKDVEQPLAFPSALTRPNRTLSFQGRLTDTAQNPILVATNMKFRLYDSGPSTSGGTLLWDSGTCSVTPDQDGIFAVGLGADCGGEIGSNVFSENANVWLQVEVAAEVLSPRQSIKSVAYALNSETLQGYPASASAVENTVVVMNNSGEIVLGNTNPVLKATGTSFAIEAQTLTLRTTSGSNGNIVLDPDGTGKISLIGPVDVNGYIKAPGATLSATYAGGTALTLNAGPSATADIMRWQSSTQSTLGVIDESGNIGIGSANPAMTVDIVGTGRFSGLLTTTGISNGTTAIANSASYTQSGTSANTFTGTSTFSNGTYSALFTGGNVGIGSATPIYNLDVNGTGRFTGALKLDSTLLDVNNQAGSSGQVLSSTVTGVDWVDLPAASANYWKLSNGTLSPFSDTLDLLVGSGATASAKFAILNVNSGTPTASISSGVSGTSAFLTADGKLGTANRMALQIGNSAGFDTTGNVLINSNGTGNVGIGNTNPLVKLHVSGGDIAAIGTNTTLALGDSLAAGDYGYLTWNTASDYISLGTQTGGAILNVTEGANVGIGTVSPGSKLDVNGYISAPGATLSASYAGGTALTLKAGPSATANVLSWQTSTGTVKGVIDETGNIGIGTSNPLAVGLHITIGSDASSTLSSNGDVLITDNDSGGFAGIDLMGNNTNGGGIISFNDNAAGVGEIRYAHADNSLRFKANSTEYLTVLSDGNIGVGDTTPTFRLDVNGTGRFTGALKLDSTLLDVNNQAGSSGQVLSSTVTGVDWIDLPAAGDNYWRIASGSISPVNDTLDLFVGSNATASAKFAVLNVNNGTPNASVSSGVSGNSMFMTADGSLSTTRRQSLTIGNSATYDTTGNVLINPNGTGNVGIGTTTPAAAFALHKSSGTAMLITGPSTGIGIFLNSGYTSGTGLNVFGGSLTNGEGIDVSGAATNAVFTGSLIRARVSRTATTSVTESGNYLEIDRSANTINGGGQTLTVTGDLVNMLSNCTQTAGTCTDTANILELDQQYTNASGAVLNILNAGTGPSIQLPATNSIIGGLQFGTAGTMVNLYRSADNTLASNATTLTTSSLATFTTASSLTMGSTSTLTLASNSTINGGSAADDDLTLQGTSNATRTTSYVLLQPTAGNVGIGSASPSQKLDVVGAIRLGTAGAGNVLNTSASAAPSGSLFWGDRTICDSSGSCAVGIGNYWRLNLGTISPVNDTLDLLVGSNATASAKFAVLNVNNGTPTASISSGVSGTSMFMTADGTLAATKRANLTIGNSSTYDTTGNVLINSNGTGNVGIGTTAPAHNVDVISSGSPTLRIGTTGGTGNVATLVLRGHSSTDDALVNEIQFRTNNGGGIAAAIQSLKGAGSGDGYLAFQTRDSTLNTKMTLSQVGNLGIGSTTPSQKIDVVGAIRLGTAGAGNVLNTSVSAAPSGSLFWGDRTICDSSGSCAVGIGNYWRLNLGTISPVNDTLDFMVGANATASAKFAVLNVNSGTPTASISSGVSGTSMFMTADGTLAATKRANLTIGNSSTYNTTGNVLINPNGTGNTGIGTSSPVFTLDVGGEKIGIAGTQMIYRPAAMTGTVYFGNGGGALSHTTAGQGYYNTATGLDALLSTTTGANNTANGFEALKANTIGYDNTAIGVYSLKANIDGIENTAVGIESLTSNVSGSQNVAVGRQALYDNNGSGNTAVGELALLDNTTANYNIALGFEALRTNRTGEFNTVIGSQAGLGTLASSNVSGNTILGYQAGYGILTGADYNTLLGYQAGDALTTGKRNIIIGYNTDPVSATGDDQLNIGSTIYGDLSTDNVGIGTSTLSAFKLTVAGNIGPSANNTYDLGSSGTKWANVYATAFTQNGNTVCDSSGNCGSIGNYWRLNLGTISTVNDTLDLLVGSNATASAKFAVLNVNNGTPVASISSGVSGTAAFLTAGGKLGTSNRLSLEIGNSSGFDTTGNVFINSNGTGNVGIGTTASDAKLQVAGDILTSNGEAYQSFSPNGAARDLMWITTGTNGQTRLRMYRNANTNSYADWYWDTVNSRYIIADTLGGSVYGGILISPTVGTTMTVTEASSGTQTKDNTFTLQGQYWNGAATVSRDATIVHNITATTPASQLDFSVAGATNLSLLDTGNLGIGTTSPNSALDVAGYIKAPAATLSATYAGGVALTLNAGPSATADIMQWQSSAGSVLGVINSAGNLGIGTSTAANFKLEIAGSIGPTIDDNYDLGSDTKRWRDVYIGADSLHIGTSTTDEGTLSYNSTSNIFNFGTDSTTNADIAFFTDDLYLDKSSGNIGIGTTAPVNMLDIVGGHAKIGEIGFIADFPELIFNGYYNGANQVYTSSDSSFAIKHNQTSDYLSFNYAPVGVAGNTAFYTSAMAISLTGNVGIGTTVPLATLDVAGSASSSGVLTFRGTTNPEINALNGEDLRFQTSVGGDTGLNERMFIANSGNVGIGSGFVTPTARLHVYGTSGETSPAIKVDSDNGGAIPSIFVENNDVSGQLGFRVYGSGYGGNIYGFSAASLTAILSNNKLAFGTTTANDIAFLTNNTRQMTLTSGGNLGIGTSTPLAELDIEGSASSSGTLSFRGTTDPKINVLNGESFGVRTSVGGDAGLTERLTVLAGTGNVGIGSVTPQGKLEIVKDTPTNGSAIETDYALRIVDGTDDVGLLFGVSATDNASVIQSLDPGTGWATRPLALMPKGGNVGIGTTGPGASLQIGSPAGTEGAMSTTFRSYAGALGSSAGDQVVAGSIGFGASSNTVALGVRGYRASAGSTWTTTAIALGMDVDNTALAGAEIWLHNGGNVGIGTHSPTRKFAVETDGASSYAKIAGYGTGAEGGLILYGPRGTQATPTANSAADVLGSIYFGGFDTAETYGGRIYGIAAAAWGGSATDAPTDIRFATAPDGSETRADRMTIQSNGNVGIGTTAAITTLQVAGTASVSGTLSVGDNTTSVIRPSAGGNLTFQRKSAVNTWADAMMIQNGTGNIGIGTANPAFKLQVSGGRAQVVATTEAYAVGVTRSEASSETFWLGVSAGGAGGDLQISDAAGNAMMNIDDVGTTGNVAIGTTAALEKLTISGNATVSGTLTVGDNATSAIIRPSAGRNLTVQRKSGSNAWTDVMTFQNGSGNVGIGIAAPLQVLHVKTTADAPPVRFEDSSGYCEINPTVTTWTCTSDARLKKDIASLSNSDNLAKLENLRAVSFLWKNQSNDTKRFGFIAQEVEQIFPEFVSTDAQSGTKSVAYGSFTPIIISALQEQQQQIENIAVIQSQNVTFTSEGSLAINGNAGNYTVTASGTTLTTIIGSSKAVIGKITAGLLSTKELVVQQSASIADLSVNSLKVSGQNINDYIRNIVQQELQTTSLPAGSVAESFTTETLTVNEDASISGELAAATITAQTITSGTSALGSLLAETATISGDLTVEQNASVAGTLIADNITAQSSRFQTLEARMAELENIKAQTAQIVDATVSGTLYADSIYNFDEKVAGSLQKPSLLQLLTNSAPQQPEAASPASIYEPVETAGYQSVNPDLIATDSAILSLNESDVVLGASALFVEKYLEVNGHAYVAQTLGIGDSLKIGNSLVITNGTIDYHPAGVDAPVLALQTSGKGKIDLLAGVMTIEKGSVAITGNMNVAGTLKANTLLTNLVQPADFGNPFQVQVAGVSTESGEIKKSRFEIINETGEAVATFDADGNASFQGGVSVGNQNLTTEDASDDTVTTEKSSGQAKLASGKAELKIQTPKATPNSLIYVTPKGSTSNKVMYIKGQGEGEFTVGFDEAISNDVEFNWWIVN